MLHQENTNDPDPMNWRVAYKPDGHSWRGLTKEDAYGAALDYMESVGRGSAALGLSVTARG